MKCLYNTSIYMYLKVMYMIVDVYAQALTESEKKPHGYYVILNYYACSFRH